MVTRKISRIVVCAIIAFATTWAAEPLLEADGFAQGLAHAKDSDLPLVVLVHGAAWQKLSQRMLEQFREIESGKAPISSPAVMCEISIEQNPEPQDAEQFKQQHADWNPKSYRTLPTLQIYSSDGHLLVQRDGESLRNLDNPEKFAASLSESLNLLTTRSTHLNFLHEAENDTDPSKLLEHLDQLMSLPIKHDAASLELLKSIDSNDQLGWQARSHFPNWDAHLRDTTARIKDGKAAAVLEESNQRLESGFANPQQKALILGSKAMAQVALDQLPDAWQSFQAALAMATDDPVARAIHHHGIRVAGLPLREVLPYDSQLHGQDIGTNLTRDFATFTMSSSDSDNPDNHPSLFRGPHSPSGFAFHTAAEKDAHIIINLHGPCRIKA
ncbi:MAG: hypothetical protein ACO3RV_09705, partial [Luteolibacter sp.]